MLIKPFITPYFNSDSVEYYKILSRCDNITLDIILQYPDKSWDWWYLSQHPNITLDIIMNFSNLPWNWYYLSKNPNLFNFEKYKKHLENMKLIKKELLEKT